MTDNPHRFAASVFGKRLRYDKPPTCPVCRLPFHGTELVIDVIDIGTVHAYCADDHDDD